MKIARHKKVQRFLNFYQNYFKFREPYQLLVDGTFCFAARQEQINIKEQLPKYLGAEAKLLTTRCIVLESERIAKKALGAFAILKLFAVHQCGHKTPIDGAGCIRSMIGEGNASHYVVATQDRALQDALRSVPGVPLLYLHKKSPTLEAPSEASQQFSERLKENCTITDVQRSTIEELKQISGLPTESEAVRSERKRKKKKGGPNPLSCLKKKKNKKGKGVGKPEVSAAGGKKKRKRVRIKVAAHIKNAGD